MGLSFKKAMIQPNKRTKQQKNKTKAKKKQKERFGGVHG